ncbi:Ig-like domain-containing protein, partial [Enterococcus hirae]|uniref:Ig-like domain-containing protein n=1 Tax=Enterococcus hirae TaxID=1354 RepID=UPI0039A51E1F
MKKKQLKKRMKAKKRLTSAAVALLMSGSLLPVGNVFADEQSTQESSISSVEEKADLEKGMTVSGIENSTESKQKTQNTEKTSGNSEDDKISIPETARDSKEATKSSTQDTSSELPEGLRNVKSTRLSDGRISVDISNFEELKAAFNTPAVSQVNLVNDILFTSNIDNPTNPELTINGNGRIINFSNYRIYSTNKILRMKNLTTLNGKNGNHTFIDYRGGTVELTNITHKGGEFIDALHIYMNGNVDIEITESNGSWNALGNYYQSTLGSIIINKDANVHVYSNLTTGAHSMFLMSKCGLFEVKENAKFKVDAPVNSWTVFYDGTHETNWKIDSGATFEVNAGKGVRPFWVKGKSFIAEPMSTVKINSDVDYAFWLDTANSVINFSEANVDIKTISSNGTAIYSPRGQFLLNNKNVQVWLKGLALSSKPQYQWNNVSGAFSVVGVNSSNVLTNNSQFNAMFTNKDYSRIVTNGSATQELTKTTINEVKDTDTTVSGKGEPNGKIELKVGDQVIASGTVGSDGNYSLTIPKQSAGTVIKAVVSMDGQSSEANTTVVRTALAQTTISEINTETTQVSGKGEPNAPIKIMNGDQIIAQGVVGSDGNYTLTIPRQAKDSVIKAIVEKDGLTSEAQTTVKQGSLAQTTISEINTETTQVSGKGEPNAPIKIMNGDQIIAQGVIGSDGNYTLTIPKQAKDSVIKAIVEKDGLTSKAQTTVTQGSLVQTTISNIDTNTTSVSGKGEPNAKIELKVENQVIASGRIGSDGNYSLTIPKQSVGTVVKAVVSANGLTSEAHTTVTRAELAPTTISKVDSQTTVITGTGEPGGKIELLNGHQLIAQGYVGKDGHYSLTVMKQPAGSTIVAKVTMDGKESQASTVVEEKINLQAPVIDKFTEGDVYAKGNIAGDAKKVAIFVNGVQRRVAAVSNGKYSIYAGDLGLKAGDKFEIAGIAADGTIGPKTSATVQKNPVLELTTTIDKFTEGDAYAKGTAGKDATKVAIFVNGVQRRVAAVSNGKYSIYAGDLGLKAGDKFEIAGIAGNGTIGPKTSAIVQKKVVLELTTTIDKFTEGDAYAKGTVGKDATKVA